MSNELQQDRVVQAGDPYTRTHWENNKTPLNAANLNNIENGIEQNTKAIINETNERKLADIAINTELDAVEEKTGLIYPVTDKDGNMQNKVNFDLANCFVFSDLNEYAELVQLSQYLSDNDLNISLFAALLCEIYTRVKGMDKLGLKFELDLSNKENPSVKAEFNDIFKYLLSDSTTDTQLTKLFNDELNTNNIDLNSLGGILYIYLDRIYKMFSKLGFKLNVEDSYGNVTIDSSNFNYNTNTTNINSLIGHLITGGKYRDLFNNIDKYSLLEVFAYLLKEIDADKVNLTENYSTTQQVSELINNAVSSLFKFKGTKDSIDLLPTSANQGDVYQVADKEYAWNGKEWVELGFNIDLTPYATTAQLEDLKNKLPENIDMTNLISFGNDYPDENVNTQYYVKLNATEVVVNTTEQGTVQLKVGSNTSIAEYYRDGNLVYISGSLPDTGATLGTFNDIVELYFDGTNTTFYKPVINVDFRANSTFSYAAIYNMNGQFTKRDLSAPTLPDEGSFSFQFITNEPFYK